MRSLPKFTEGERALLGCCLIDPEIIPEVLDLLQPADMYHDAHRLSLHAISQLYTECRAIDWATLTEKLKKGGNLKKVGGKEFLVELSDAVPSAANWRHYAEKVKEKSDLRRIIADCEQIQDMCFQLEADPLEIGNEFHKRSSASLSAKETGDLVPERVAIQKYIRSLEDGSGKPFKTGFLAWDDLLGGLFKGQFVVIGGRPSMGKSSLLLCLLKSMLATTDFGMALFSLEMTEAQISARRISERCKIPIHELRCGNIPDYRWDSIIERSADFYDSRIYLSDVTGITCSQIERKVLKAERAYGLKFHVIGIDFLQLMASENRERDEVKRLDSIAYGLQALAKRLDCCVIALSQLSNTIDQRPAFTVGKGKGQSKGIVRHGRRPTLADIRGSGFIVAAARLVIGLYRASAYEEEMEGILDPDQIADYRNKAQAIVRKNNDGPCGIIRLGWHPETATFTNRSDVCSEETRLEQI